MDAHLHSTVYIALGQSELPSALRQTMSTGTIALDPHDVIDAETLAANRVLLGALKKIKEGGGRLHLLGLASDGNVSASLDHLSSIIEIAHRYGVRVVVHAFLDGMDVPTKTAPRYIELLEAQLDASVGRLGTVSGRSFAMAAPGRWERVDKVYKAILADGVDRHDSAQAGIREACMFGNPEQFVAPFVVFDYPGATLVDYALCHHFNSEGIRQLSRALAGAECPSILRRGGRGPFAGRFLSMTPCDNELPSLFARSPDPTELPLEMIQATGRHVVALREGSASALGDGACSVIQNGEHDCVVVDFADPANLVQSSSAELDAALASIAEAVNARSANLVIVGSRNVENRVSIAYRGPTLFAAIRDSAVVSELPATLLALLGVPHDDESRSIFVD